MTELIEGRAAGSNAQAIIDHATLASEPIVVDDNPPRALVHALPAGAVTRVQDLEAFRTAPTRKRGTVTAMTVEALLAYLERHKTEDTTVWVHPTSGEIVAVVEDHGASTPNWGDHRAKLSLIPTDEWKFWTDSRKNGALLDQQAFAEHIEQGELEFRDPSGADMLEIATSIHASSSGKFKSRMSLESGAVTLEYVEEIDGKAGKSGDLPIPREFTLGITPFVGEHAYELKARLRYRVRDGQLKLGYVLIRPDDVLRDCLETIAVRLRAAFPNTYLGTPRAAAPGI